MEIISKFYLSLLLVILSFYGIIPKNIKGTKVKAPKGFGKQYFSFASMQAHSIQIKLNATHSSCTNLLYKLEFESDDESNDSPDEELILSPLSLKNSKPCHCNCYFNTLSKRLIRLFRFIPRCPFYDTFFAFRRSGVHPPKSYLY